MWGIVSGITLLTACIILFDWPKIERKQKKEKISFVILLTLGWCLSILLVYQPELPGPTKFVDIIFKPLGKMLE
jgi:multisubunit Na+/H+ antiporter MnhB subunit